MSYYSIKEVETLNKASAIKSACIYFYNDCLGKKCYVSVQTETQIGFDFSYIETQREKGKPKQYRSIESAVNDLVTAGIREFEFRVM